MRSGLITLEQLQDVALFDDFRRETLQEFPLLGDKIQGRRLLYESIRRMLSAQVYDVIDTTGQALVAARPQSVDEIRQMAPLLQFSECMRTRSQALKTFLLHQLYRHPQVMHTTGQAQQVVRDLFEAYLQSPQEMPDSYQTRTARLNDTADDAQAQAQARVVADYIAGMTDRFAGREHARLTGQQLLP